MFDDQRLIYSDLSPITEQAAHGDWYVIYCQPRKEQYAAMALREQRGLPVYLPEVACGCYGQVEYTPLFPGYLFVKADLALVPPSHINATPGVARMVTFDEDPQPVPVATISALHEQVQRLNAHGGLPEQVFQPGDPVQINSGPLCGLEAVFVGPTTPSERVQILLTFMGRLSELQVGRDTLTAISPAPAHKRPRRTRGRGRKIKSLT